jgi:hypothetical protein
MKIGCTQNSLSETKWKVVATALVDNNNYGDFGRLDILQFDPSLPIYSYYTDRMLIKYWNCVPETTTYAKKGHTNIFYRRGFDNDTTRILNQTADSLVLRTTNGAFYPHGKGFRNL